MSQRTTIMIVAIVAAVAVALWVTSRLLLGSAVEPTPAESAAPSATEETETEEPEPIADMPAPARPDFSDEAASARLSDADRATADGLYRDLKSAADSIGDARDQVRLPVGTLTLESPKRAADDPEEGEATEPDPDPEH